MARNSIGFHNSSFRGVVRLAAAARLSRSQITNPLFLELQLVFWKHVWIVGPLPLRRGSKRRMCQAVDVKASRVRVWEGWRGCTQAELDLVTTISLQPRHFSIAPRTHAATRPASPASQQNTLRHQPSTAINPPSPRPHHTTSASHPIPPFW